MSLHLAYPSGNYDPAPLVDLSDPRERERLSLGAVRAFLNIMERWKVRNEDARQLLGGISNGAFHQMKREPGRTLDEDRLVRISYLVGIYKALHILHGPELADRWMSLPNSNRIFRGSTPLAYLMRGGLPAFATVRRLLDARRGGL